MTEREAILDALPDSVRDALESPWQPVSAVAFGAASLLLSILVLCVWTSSDGWVPFLDSANLAFHEAGHPLFGLLGETLGLYGGTLMQLLVPVLALGSFWLRREAVGAACAAAWLCENLLNVARYMADARVQLLPLVGGGEHDWWNILTRWGLLNWDTRLAGALRFVAWLGILVAWIWLALRWRASQR